MQRDILHSVPDLREVASSQNAEHDCRCDWEEDAPSDDTLMPACVCISLSSRSCRVPSHRLPPVCLKLPRDQTALITSTLFCKAFLDSHLPTAPPRPPSFIDPLRDHDIYHVNFRHPTTDAQRSVMTTYRHYRSQVRRLAPRFV